MICSRTTSSEPLYIYINICTIVSLCGKTCQFLGKKHGGNAFPPNAYLVPRYMTGKDITWALVSGEAGTGPGREGAVHLVMLVGWVLTEMPGKDGAFLVKIQG